MFCVLCSGDRIQAAEEEVNRLFLEAQESMVMGRWLDLASLTLSSADLMFAKVSEKGNVFFGLFRLSAFLQ